MFGFLLLTRTYGLRVSAFGLFRDQSSVREQCVQLTLLLDGHLHLLYDVLQLCVGRRDERSNPLNLGKIAASSVFELSKQHFSGFM